MVGVLLATSVAAAALGSGDGLRDVTPGSRAKVTQAAVGLSPRATGDSRDGHTQGVKGAKGMLPASKEDDAVYVVLSRDSYRHVQGLVKGAQSRRDALGQPLVLAETHEAALQDVSLTLHAKEARCGGFFAFDSRAQAEAFVAGDQALKGVRSNLVAYTIDNQSTIGPWLPQVSEGNIYGSIQHLSTAYLNRHYATTTGAASANWIRNTWQSLAAGRTDVTTELFTGCTNCASQPSVILTIQGNELAGEVVVLGGHLDSISNSGTGESMNAPGADDDASGIATLTEVIRVALASGWKPKRTVKFMGYAAEEVGLRGSNAIAQSFKASGVNVVGVLQLDMTNWRVGGEDMRIISDYSNADLKVFFAQLFDTYLAPAGLVRGTFNCGYACSDHASWNTAGYPAAMMFEGGTGFGNPNIHKTTDTLTSMQNSAANSVKFAKFGLAFLGEMAKTSNGVNIPPLASFTYTADKLNLRLTDTSSDPDGTIVSWLWDFGGGQTSPERNPSYHFEQAGSYRVTLTVTDDDGATASTTQTIVLTDELSKGIPVNGLYSTTSHPKRYTMQVPPNASNLVFLTSGGSGDVDMYVQYGQPPTDSSYDCKSTTSGNQESCVYASPSAGMYHVMLVGVNDGYTGVTLLGDYTPYTDPSRQTYSNATDVSITDNATVYSDIAVASRTGNAPNDAIVSVRIDHSFAGDLRVDLVAPDGSTYLLYDRDGASISNIYWTWRVDLAAEALNGTWRLKVTDTKTGDVGKIDTWSINM